ncbi:M6 family metalloprotease domain-containing protein [Microbacterium pumilum]|uniref:Peptidase M6-like domain-containing protein n=1 Tax=Microbacterium pumilum TaxID=344165 RepID=A0ABP5DS22_9MICO
MGASALTRFIAIVGTATLTVTLAIASSAAAAPSPESAGAAPSGSLSAATDPPPQTDVMRGANPKAPDLGNPLARPTVVSRGAPADSTLRKFVQPDGTTFAARAVGDAVSSAVRTEDGHVIVQDESEQWVYATRSGGASDLVVGEDAAPRAVATAPADPVDPPQGFAVEANNVGTQRTLVILVSFTNRPSVGSTAAQWSAKYFGAGNSVRSYYKQASYNQLDFAPALETQGTVNDGVVGWLQLPYAHPNAGGAYYQQVNGVIPSQAVTRDAILAANPYVNYANYDTNGDSVIEPSELHITVIMAGYESAMLSGCPATGAEIWGHQWSLLNGYLPPAATTDGKWVGAYGYTQFGEWHASCPNTETGTMATIGIMAHEIGHDIGWPDLYDAYPGGNNPDSAGIGVWSIMSGGSWNQLPGQRPGDTPSLPDAWSKYLQGWVQPTAYSPTATTVSLGSAATNPHVVRLLDNPNGVDWKWAAGTGEYFLIENRQREGYDAALPGCGLLIWHIDETRVDNGDENHRLVDLEEADGRNDLNGISNDGDAGDPFPGSTAKLAFNVSSTPNSRLYSGAASGVSVSVSSTSCASPMSATVATNGIPPANDAFAGATVIDGVSGTRTATTVGATKEAGEPAHAGNGGGHSIWYSWTAPASGTLTVTTTGSTFNTLLGIYRGSSVTTLTADASNDDEPPGGLITSRVSDLAVTAGTVYRFAVDGFGGATGSVNLTWNLTAPAPANDLFAAATTLTGASGAATGTNVAATKEPGEPVHAGNAGGSSVWYSWTAPVTGTLDLSTEGSTFDTLLAIYQGSAVGALTPKASNDDDSNETGVITSRIEDFAVTAGQVYRIAVDGYLHDETVGAGQIALAWQTTVVGPPPANDSFASPITLAGAGGTLSGTNTDATKQAGEPNHAGNVGGRSVWYSWTAPATGQLSVSTGGSDLDSLLGVYVGSSVGSLVVTAQNDDENFDEGIYTSTLSSVPVLGGQTYRIAVDGYNLGTGTGAASGPFTLTWAFSDEFTSLVPSRVLDTRSGVGRPGTSKVAAGGTVTLDVTGVGGVPASGVSAVVLSITTTQSATGGRITVYPSGQPKPNTTDVSYQAGANMTGLAIAKVGADGNVRLFSTAATHMGADVVGYFPSGSEFTSLKPARVLDTRSGVGRPGTAQVPAGGTVTLDVTGVGGVPASGVSAVVVSITTTQSATAGRITVYPSGQAKPTATNVSYQPGANMTGLAIAKVGADGNITLASTAATHMGADVVGYFPSGSQFTSLTPARLLDTRSGVGRPGTAQVPAGGTVTLDVTGVGGVPASGVSAVIVSITTTQSTTAGRITVYPSDQPRPTATNVSYQPGANMTGLAIAKVGADGTINLFSTAATHMGADVVGYFPTP